MHGEEISVDNISKKFGKTLDAPAFPLSSKHNLSHLLPEELPADLLHTPFVWLHRGGICPPSPAPLLRPLRCPVPGTPLLHHPSRVEGRGHLCQPPEGLHVRGHHAWQSAMLQQTAGLDTVAKPAIAHPGGPAATKRVSFSDLLVFHPQLGHRQEKVQEPFFSHLGRIFARPGPATPSSPQQMRYPQ